MPCVSSHSPHSLCKGTIIKLLVCQMVLSNCTVTHLKKDKKEEKSYLRITILTILTLPSCCVYFSVLYVSSSEMVLLLEHRGLTVAPYDLHMHKS